MILPLFIYIFENHKGALWGLYELHDYEWYTTKLTVLQGDFAIIDIRVYFPSFFDGCSK
jgi:hypothetical protein